jgi:hypothetical protein
MNPTETEAMLASCAGMRQLVGRSAAGEAAPLTAARRVRAKALELQTRAGAGGLACHQRAPVLCSSSARLALRLEGGVPPTRGRLLIRGSTNERHPAAAGGRLRVGRRVQPSRGGWARLFFLEWRRRSPAGTDPMDPPTQTRAQRFAAAAADLGMKRTGLMPTGVRASGGHLRSRPHPFNEITPSGQPVRGEPTGPRRF